MTPFPAPGPLADVEAFCNSVNHLRGRDEWAETSEARAWCTRHGHRGELTPDETASLRDARESLRGVIVDRESAAARDALNTVLRRYVRAPGLGSEGTLELVPSSDRVVDRVVAAALGAFLSAGLDRDGARLKACQAPACRWIFYDRSPARVGVWCDMAVCGSRAKMARYRA